MREGLYKPEYCIEVIRMGQEGKSPAQMAAALGVCKETVFNWSKNAKHPEFKVSFDIAQTCSQAYWEDIGIKGTKGILNKFNVAAWIFNMKNRFRDDYKESSEQKVDINNSVKSMSDEDIEETIKVLVARKMAKDQSSGSLPEATH